MLIIMNCDRTTIIMVLIMPLISISLVIMFAPTITPAFAAGTFSEGWSDGKKNSVDTFLNGGTFNDECGMTSSDDISYCQGYKVGYRDGWTNAQLFH